MGVMPCYRAGCPNILCDHFLNGHYICLECQMDFDKLLEDWPKQMTRAGIKRRIEEFFAKSKDDYEVVDVDEAIKKLEEP